MGRRRRHEWKLSRGQLLAELIKQQKRGESQIEQTEKNFKKDLTNSGEGR